MSFPGPDLVPELWRLVILGGHAIPPDLQEGAATCEVKPSQKVDQKKPAGKNKAKSTEQGLQPAKVTVRVQFTPRIFPQMQAIFESLWPPKGPVDIAHPNSAIHSVRSVIILGASGVSWSDSQVGSYEWDCEEFDAPAAEAGKSLLLRKGSTGPEVTRWQKFLAEQGFDPGPVDGLFGPKTEQATKDFQTREKILVDGIVGPETFGTANKRFGYPLPPPVKGGGSATKTPAASEPAKWVDTTPTAKPPTAGPGEVVLTKAKKKTQSEGQP